MLEDIRTITKLDKDYPELLRKIKDPPEKLYFLGKILPKEVCVAIVGSRRCSAYGRQMAFDLAFGLAKAGVAVVSGFAPGVDTVSHQGVLEASGRTIAVLGTGLDKKSIYPQSNVKLVEQIVDLGGALISEYPPGTHGSKFTFPKRNRIIAGISLGVVVVEGKEKSGSLITANYALREKRKLFAVPGQAGNLLSRAPNLLLKRGASLIESSRDILNSLGIFKPGIGPASKLPEDWPVKPGLKNPVLEVLALESPLHIDEIIEKSNLPAQKVAALLGPLEIEGKVRNFGGKTYGLIFRNARHEA